MKRLLILLTLSAIGAALGTAICNGQNLVLGGSAKDTVKTNFYGQQNNTRNTIDGLNANAGTNVLTPSLIGSNNFARTQGGTITNASLFSPLTLTNPSGGFFTAMNNATGGSALERTYFGGVQKWDWVTTATTKRLQDSQGNVLITYTDQSGTTFGSPVTTLSTLTISAPSIAAHAATKSYVDTADALKVAKAGDTMTGSLVLPAGASGAPSLYFTGLSPQTGFYVEGTGIGLTVSALPVAKFAAEDLRYFVPSIFTNNGVATTIRSNVITSGTLTLSGVAIAATPTLSPHLATKGYVDGYAQPLDSDLTAIAALSANGMLARTGTGTMSARTITAGTDVSVSNGDGVSGNPTISLPSTLAANAKVAVNKNSGATVGTRRRVNFIEGANITLTIADDAGNEEVDVTIAAAGGGGSPGGSDTQIQFNDAGVFNGDAGLVYNKTTDALTLNGNFLLGTNANPSNYKFVVADNDQDTTTLEIVARPGANSYAQIGLGSGESFNWVFRSMSNTDGKHFEINQVGIGGAYRMAKDTFRVSLGGSFEAGAQLHVKNLSFSETNIVQEAPPNLTAAGPWAGDLMADTITSTGTIETMQSIEVASGTTYLIEARVTARRTGGVAGTAEDGAAYVRRACIKNVAGTATIIGSVDASFTAESQAGWDCTLDVAAGSVRVRVTGAANNNVAWQTLTKMQKTSQ